MSDREPILCDRCLCELRPGHGEHYEVRIEAVADPSPPVLDIHDTPSSDGVRPSLSELTHEMKDLSAREAMDQVVRRLTICLCLRCYQRWIENPTGAEESP